MTKTKIKIGDEVRVVRIAESFEQEGYEVGDVYTVIDIDETPRDFNPAEGALIITEDYELYENEVEKVEVDLFERIDSLFSPSIVMVEAVNSPLPPSIGFGEGAHGMNTPGKRAPADAVNSPSHYTQGGVEVIDIIAQTVSGYDDGFTAHCVGTATKYLNRAPHKHATPLEDLEKAAKYLEFAIKHEKKKAL